MRERRDPHLLLATRVFELRSWPRVFGIHNLMVRRDVRRKQTAAVHQPNCPVDVIDL